MKESILGQSSALIFGQGRVRGTETVKKIKMGDMPSSNGYLNWWGSEIVEAGRVLFRKGTTKTFIVMGGKTGGVELDSEAELVGNGIKFPFIGNEEVPNVVEENSSTNTIENLVNYCNEQLDQPGVDNAKNDVEGSSFHLTRVKILLILFGIPYQHVIGADSVMLYKARAGEEIDTEMLIDIQNRHDGNASQRVPLNDTEARMDRAAKDRGHNVGYYAARDDMDEATILQKQQDEDWLIRALLELPDYSLPYFARIQNDDRLMTIMRNFDNNFFPATDTEPSALIARGINLGTDTPDVIRAKLGAITRDLPDAEKRAKWIKENTEKVWGIEEKFQRILYTAV